MRILFVGDSMTLGSAGDYTWRYRMWQHLTRTCEEPVHVVGPHTALRENSHAYAADDFPPSARRHLAGWGCGWIHQAPRIAEVVHAHQPDTLLVSLGLIDLGFYTNPRQTEVNVRRFLAEARGAKSTLRVAILPVLRNIRAETDPEFAAHRRQFGALLEEVVAELSTPSAPLLLVSAPKDWDVARDTYDGTHPSVEGEHRIAAAFAAALHQAWQLGGRYGRVG